MSLVPLPVRIVAALYLASMMFALGLELGGARESKAEKGVRRRVLLRGKALTKNLRASTKSLGKTPAAPRRSETSPAPG